MMEPVPVPDSIRVNTITLAFTLLAGIVVFLRLFTRLVMTRGAGFEDALIGLAMVFSIALAVVTSEQIMHGLGKHSRALEDEELMSLLKAFWASMWIYNLTLTVTKVSILVQYLRIFPIQRFQYACYVLLGIVIACGTWGVFGNIFLCSPLSLIWDRTVDGKCMNQYIILFSTAALNIAQDASILLLPIPVIRTLQIPASQKKGLVTTLALGASVIVCSVVRLYTLDALSNSRDIPYDNRDQATMSVVEANVGIVCACLPAMRPLFALMMPKYFAPGIQCTKDAIGDAEPGKYMYDKRVPTPVPFSKAHHFDNNRHPPRSSSLQSQLKEMERKAGGSKVSVAQMQTPRSNSETPSFDLRSIHSRTPDPRYTPDPNSGRTSLQVPPPLTSLQVPPPLPVGERGRSASNSSWRRPSLSQLRNANNGSGSANRNSNHIVMAMTSTKHPGRRHAHGNAHTHTHSRSASATGNYASAPTPTPAPITSPVPPRRLSSLEPPRLSHLAKNTAPASPSTSTVISGGASRRTSDSSLYVKRLSSWRRSMSGRQSMVGKPLPLTPFPVGLEASREATVQEANENTVGCV